jgi:hypothetical protein
MQMGTGLTLKNADFLSGDGDCHAGCDCYDTDEMEAMCLSERRATEQAKAVAPYFLTVTAVIGLERVLPIHGC